MIDVEEVLEDIGVEITSVGEREISAFCPVHENYIGHPNVNTPAFSINKETGLWICYSCGAAGSLASLVEEVTGEVAPDFASSLKRAGIQRKISVRQTAEEVAPEPEPEPVVDEYTYKQFVAVPKKLLALRQIDPDVAWQYGLRWNTQDRYIVIPVRDPGGVLLGWQAKAVGYFNNIPKGMKVRASLFGWHQHVDKSQYESRVCSLVESPLDVVRLASAHVYNVFSTYGTSASPEQVQMLAPFFRVILAYDNDIPGRAAATRIATMLGNHRCRYVYYGDRPYKDPGDFEDNGDLAGVFAQAYRNHVPEIEAKRRLKRKWY